VVLVTFAVRTLRQVRRTAERAEATLERLAPTLDRLDLLIDEARVQVSRIDKMMEGATNVVEGAASVRRVVQSAGEGVLRGMKGPDGLGANLAYALYRGFHAFRGFRGSPRPAAQSRPSDAPPQSRTSEPKPRGDGHAQQQ